VPRLDLNNLDNIQEVAHFARALQGVNLGESARLFLRSYAGVFSELAIRARMLLRGLMLLAVMEIAK